MVWASITAVILRRAPVALLAFIVLVATGCATPPTVAPTTPAATATPIATATLAPTLTPAPSATVPAGPPLVVLEEPAYRGVIFSAEMARRQDLIVFSSNEAFEYWTPTPQQIAALEADLLPFLQTDEHLRDGIGWRRPRPLPEALPDFTRQYFGYRLPGGDDMIYASFFCDLPLDELRDAWVEVLDGGDCYFQVHYNATTGTYERLSVNGEA
jgi:hypothetical protein